MRSAEGTRRALSPIPDRRDTVTDPGTIATYEAVADRYRERHADRSGVADVVERFPRAGERGVGGRARPRRQAVAVRTRPGVRDVRRGGHEVVGAGLMVGVGLTPAFLRIARAEVPSDGTRR